MWLCVWIYGSCASESMVLSRSTLSWCSCRSTPLRFRYEILADAPATTDGGRDDVKMNPGAKLRTVSINTELPAIYPPNTPKPLANVPLMMSIRVFKLRCCAIPPPVAPYMWVYVCVMLMAHSILSIICMCMYAYVCVLLMAHSIL